MARKSPGFTFYPDSWRGGTSRMTWEEKGVYLEILCDIWLNGSVIEEHAIRLCGGASSDLVRGVLRSKFVQDDEGRWFNVRLEEERIKQRKRKENGCLGGRPQKAKRKLNHNLNHNQNVTKTKAKPKHSDSDSDSVSNTDTDLVSRNGDSSAVASTTKPAGSVLLTFPCSGSPKSWELSESQLTAWKELYPQLDVLAECRKALAWVKANTKKTANGMPRFLVKWFNRSNDNHSRPAAKPVPQEHKLRILP